MSVVNKMLQDLEKRQQQPQSADYQAPASRRRGLWLVGVIPLVLLALAAYWLLPAWMDKTSTALPLQEKPVLDQVTAPATSTTKPSADDTATEQPAASAAELATPATESAPVDPAPQATSQTAATPVLAPTPANTDPVVTAQQASETVAEPEDPAVVELTITKTGADEDSRWALLKARVQQAIADKRPLDAIADLKQMLALKADNHPVRMKLAALMHDAGMQAQSGLVLEQGVKLYPQQADLRLMLARWLQGQDSNEKALMVLEEMQPELLGHGDYFALRAQLAQQQNRLELAISDYLLLSQYQPDQFRWRLGLAVSLDKAGRLQAAAEQYAWLSRQNLPPQARQFVQQRLQALGG